MNDKGSPEGLFAAKRLSSQNRAEMRELFDRAIKLAEQNRLRVRVPPEVKPTQKMRGMHYHYRPELFLQLQGRTDFQFPRDSFSLAPDELCVIPAGVPHGERVHAEPNRPFRNLVAGFYNNTVSLHFAYEARPHHPEIEVIEFFDAPNRQPITAAECPSAHSVRNSAMAASFQSISPAPITPPPPRRRCRKAATPPPAHALP